MLQVSARPMAQRSEAPRRPRRPAARRRCSSEGSLHGKPSRCPSPPACPPCRRPPSPRAPLVRWLVETQLRLGRLVSIWTASSPPCSHLLVGRWQEGSGGRVDGPLWYAGRMCVTLCVHRRRQDVCDTVCAPLQAGGRFHQRLSPASTLFKHKYIHTYMRYGTCNIITHIHTYMYMLALVLLARILSICARAHLYMR